jgi:hypothetical protein
LPRPGAPPDDGALGRRNARRRRDTMKTKAKDTRTGDRHAHAQLNIREEREGQIDEWRTAAERAGVTLAQWVRDALDRAARREE